MCFEVILSHFWVNQSSVLLTPFKLVENKPVLIFMFLSFYFMERTFLINDHSKIKKRFWRLLYPQIGWTILYWIILMGIQIKVDLGITFSDFLWQLFTGHSIRINPTMWFQTVLIFLTLLFTLTFRYLNKKGGMAFIILMTILSLWIQYSGLNLKVFGPLRFELRYPLGRISEMLPYASLGFFIAYFDIYNRLQKSRALFLILFGLATLLLLKYEYVIPPAPGFLYSHNILLIFVFFIVGFAYLLPFEQLPDKIKNILQFISRFTLGIYCMHRLIAFLLLSKLHIWINSFVLCVIIYILSFCTSYLMCRISPKYFKQLVE